MSQVTRVNLITGFLGAGKTSTLRHLLGQRPRGARWAVLVNEFGALGIDGALVGEREADAVTVREIAGGCLCCATGASFRVALTGLLRQPRPERLLIEATGLGHAGGIVDVLREPGIAQAIRLDSILGVIDAPTFDPERLARSAVLSGQLQLADVLLINKSDLASEDQLRKIEDWAAALYPPRRAVIRTCHGGIDIGLLRHDNDAARLAPAFRLADDADYHAFGLCLEPTLVFSRPALRALLDELQASPGLLRAKGLLRTGREWTRVDLSASGVTLSPFSHRRDSRLEVIHDERFPWTRERLERRLTRIATPAGAPRHPAADRRVYPGR